MLTSRWRDHVWANRAYETRVAGTGTERIYEGDFRRGFVAGYQSVSRGGDGTMPAMPPQRYWGSQYLSPDGQAKTKAWFEGFPEGVRAAQTDGIDAYRDIYVNQLLDDLNRQAPGTNPEMGRHMLDMPFEDRLPLPATPRDAPIDSAPPTPTFVQPVSHMERADETSQPTPLGYVDFATYQSAPRLTPITGHRVPVIRVTPEN